jgi:hypothetical protein
MRKFIGMAVVALLALVSSVPAFAGDVWMTSGFWSKHQNDESGTKYREQNTGFGAQWQFADDWNASAGTFMNSVDHRSRYAQVGWAPVVTSIGSARLRLGGTAGLIDGYPLMNKGGVFPSLLPVASIEYGRMGINATCIPPIKGVVAACAVQFKFSMFNL